MQKEKWLIQAKKADFQKIAAQYGISPIIARVIRNRDVISDEDIDLYINGNVENMHSPWLLKDMDRAVDIINIKINQQNKIRIICDYDIDGICSGYILLDSLKYVGAVVDVVVPHRIEDGYGINKNLIEQAIKDGVDTIITCDNGIAAVDAIDYAKKNGLTIIITDHHEVPFLEKSGTIEYIVPDADAVVNPKQSDCLYPFKQICGATVAYKLMEALFENRGISKTYVRKYLEYAAIATIGDVMELIGENRIITKYGLSLLRKSKNVGLNSLIEECGIDKDSISSYHIGFIIGPCLNASGRLDTAKKAIELLQCTNLEKADLLAETLKKLNDERKALTEKGVLEAVLQAEEYENCRILVLYLPDCHESIAGIIAGRIREKYNKPTIILTNGEGCVKGSGRSIESYDMFKELSNVKELFIKFGGHKLAAGLSLNKENVPILRNRLNELCSLTDDDFIPKIWIDTELPVEYVTSNFIEQLSILEPFGRGNEKPVFAARNLKVRSLRLLGAEGNVLKLELYTDSGSNISAICFNKTQEFIHFVNEKFGNDEIKKATRGMANNILINVLYYPKLNTYNGNTTIQMVIDKFC